MFNLLNGTVACGTLGLPLAFAQLGVGLGVAALAVMTVVNLVASRMMVAVGIAEGTASYDMTVRAVLGGRGLHTFQAMLAVGTLGSLLSYFILIGDFAAQVGAVPGAVPGGVWRRAWTCKHACMYAWPCVCAQARACACLCVCVNARMPSGLYACVRVCGYAGMRVHGASVCPSWGSLPCPSF